MNRQSISVILAAFFMVLFLYAGWKTAYGLGEIPKLVDKQGDVALGSTTPLEMLPKPAPTVQTVTLELLIHDWYSESTPDTPVAEPYFLVGTNEFTDEYRALLLFSVSTIPPDAVIVSAKLDAFLETAYVNEDIAICVHQVTGNWGTAVTWNTQPSFEAACLSNTVVGSSGSGYYQWTNLAVLVQLWVQNSAAFNRGMLLKQSFEGNPHYVSKQFTGAGQTTNRPRLIVEYMPAPPPTPTFTPTVTSTATRVPTATPSFTASPTRTSVPPTQTATATSTRTATATPSATVTPTATLMPTATKTDPANPTPTPTATVVQQQNSTLRGAIVLERRSSSADVEVCLQQTVRCTTTADNGDYQFTQLSPGPYTVQAQHASYLNGEIATTAVAGVNEVGTLTLWAGDINQDNHIASEDADLIAQAWMSRPATENWDVRADITDDGFVDIRDMVAVLFNWDRRGPLRGVDSAAAASPPMFVKKQEEHGTISAQYQLFLPIVLR